MLAKIPVLVNLAGLGTKKMDWYMYRHMCVWVCTHTHTHTRSNNERKEAMNLKRARGVYGKA